jgi:hypothetical protein
MKETCLQRLLLAIQAMELVAERPTSSCISGNAVLLLWLLIIFSRFQ